MVIMANVNCVVLTMALFELGWGNIIADPSRVIKPTHVVDDIANSGTFIRNLGTISTSKSHYKIAIPLAIGMYDQSLAQIQNSIWSMIYNYNQTFNQSSWSDELDDTGVTRQRFLYEVEKSHRRLVSQFSAIKTDYLAIVDLFYDIQPNNRIPRGLFDFIGDGLNWAFGVATESELNEAESRLIQTSAGEFNLLQSQKHLASIVKIHETQISNIQKTQLEIENHTKNLIFELKKLIFGNAAQNSKIMELTIFERLGHFEADCTHSLEILYRKIHKLGNAIQLGLQGKISSNLINPEILHKIIVDVSSNLPSHLMMPNIVDPNSFFKLYELLSVNIQNSVNSSKFMIIDFPLINDYDIFQLNLVTTLELPFSPRVNSTAKIFLEDNAIYAINVKNNMSFIVSHKQLQTSKRFFSHFYANFRKWDMVDQSLVKCILAFQSGKNVHNLCKKQIISHSNSNVISHLIDDRWGFSVRGRKKISIQCIHENSLANSSELFLEGFGEIRIPKTCNINFENVTLTGIFVGYRETKIPSISKVIPFQMAPANLAFSNIWTNISTKNTLWNKTNLDQMERDLKNELSFQIRNTFLHNKTKHLIMEVENLLQKPIEKISPWWLPLDIFNLKDGIFLVFVVLSFLLHIISFFILKAQMRTFLLKFIRQLT